MDLELHETQLTIGGDGDFLSSEYMECIRKKVEVIQRSIEQSRGRTLIFSDVDIRFYRPVQEDLTALLEESHYPILFQKEGRAVLDVSTGFFVCRCCDKVADLFDRVRVLLNERPEWHDQNAVNHLIKRGEFSDFGYLPFTYAARTHGWPPPRDARIYHANYTTGPDGVGQKIRQFAEADNAIRGSELKRLLSMLRVGAGLGPQKLFLAALRRVGIR